MCLQYITYLCITIDIQNFEKSKVFSYWDYFYLDYNDGTINFEEQLGTHLTLKGNKIHFQVILICTYKLLS